MPYKDPEKRREADRRKYHANRDKERERAHKRYQRERATRAAYYQDNKAELAVKRWARRHGTTVEEWQRLWDSQGGRCYLCEEPLAVDPAGVATDHDHACCPAHQSCRYCRRGLACMRCNTLIGFAGDDPALLLRIVQNLTRAQEALPPGRPEQTQLTLA